MLLVIVIIGILAGMLVTRLSGRSEEARLTRAKADMEGSLSLALDLFEQDLGRYPTSEEGLAALVENPGMEGWKGPYLKGDLKPDPWGTAYSYAIDAEDPGRYRLTSAGPDKRLGTTDDMVR
jgi:general secretion pathway protein G